ncbi:aldose epimerase [Paraburkholderia sp. GAS42]|jgi:galactose mutarotase-like enzyme|uniref:aldose epimerase family protein n=1 Tax=Paraburkholderia sp. GAS42 TaxID=3035135 RepID=UPI003D213FC0
MATFQNQDILEITQGASLLRIAPQAGGRLLSWDIDGEQVIYWPDDADWSQPAKVRGGNPLLFPFLARHFVDGQIGRWRDAEGVVRDLPMHGFARDLPFAAELDAAGGGVTMTLTDSDATRTAYPFGFRFEATYRLADAHTLDVALTATNTGDAPLPYYAGHHFYFALPHTQRGETTLELPPTQRRHQLADASISAAEPGETRYTLDDGRILDRFHLPEGTLDRPVRIIAPGLNRTITIDLQRPGSIPWYAVTTWTLAPESDFYCVEPWLGLPDAIHNGFGLRWLAPGATETAALRISVAAGT